jgi:hypothetical protein
VLGDSSGKTGKKREEKKVPQSTVHPGIIAVHLPSWNSNDF